MKSFVNDLVALLQVDEGNTRVAALSFAWVVMEGFSLDRFAATTDVQTRISSFSWGPSGTTNTAHALNDVRTTKLSPITGDRDSAPNVVVVITDGASDNATATTVSIPMYPGPSLGMFQVFGRTGSQTLGGGGNFGL